MKPKALRDHLYQIFFLLLLAGLCTNLLHICIFFGSVMNLKTDAGTSDAFRRQELSGKILEQLEKAEESSGLSKGTLLASWMPIQHFRPHPEAVLTEESCVERQAVFLKYRSRAYESLLSLYQAVWDDLVYFPTEAGMAYENSWMFERNYGGKRGHEGCDLMPPENKSGIYPIFSMTDGTVEKAGWLDKGGYRIGIRSPHGGYFYYAHLSDGSPWITVGQSVRAGDVIGYMGDTGYGPEGTRGKFDVHLHLGIYVCTPENPEVSVNPYWILKSLEGHKLKYRHQVCYTIP